MFDDEDLDPGELAQLDKACADAHAAFYAAFQEWKQRVDARQADPIAVTLPLSVAVPDNLVVEGKCTALRAEFAELGKQAALCDKRSGRDAYLELSDDPDELLGKEMYFWYVKYRDSSSQSSAGTEG